MNGEELAVLTTAENKSIYEQTSFEIYKLHEAIGVIGQFFNGSLHLH